MGRASPRARTASVTGAVAALALASAFAVEHGLAIAPCELCLLERWPWRIVLALAVVALFVPGVAGRAALGLAALALAASAALAALHVGVEHHWWPSPFPECHAPRLGAGSIGNQLLLMPLRAAKPCDDPTYLVPGLPVSMAAMNLLLSVVLLLFVVGGLSARAPGRR